MRSADLDCRAAPSRRGRGVFAARVAGLALVVGASWALVRGHLQSRGEAFWLLFPLWVLAGALLKVIPLPRQPTRRWTARCAIYCVLFWFPTCVYGGLVFLMGGQFSWAEWGITLYFFAISLEFMLLYVFRALDMLRQRIAKMPGRWRRLALSGAAQLAFYVVLFSMLLPILAVHRVKVAGMQVDPSWGLKVEDVSFPSRGPEPAMLRGQFFTVQRPSGSVIACHGVAGNRAELLPIVAILHEAGFQVLTFDFRGHGESEGHTVTYGEKERRDVLGAWDYLVSRPDVDRSRVFAFGFSMGASSLLLALPELPEVKAAVLDSAFGDLGTMVRHQYRFLPAFLGRPLAGLTELVGWLETGMWAGAVSPQEALAKIKLPLAFYHGEKDIVVPKSATEELYAAYRGPKTLRLDPEAGHAETALGDLDRYRDEVKKLYLEAIHGSTEKNPK